MENIPYASDIPDPDFPQLMIQLRARLHRYCARMTGSVLDGEDIVQETLIKANANYNAQTVQHIEGWLFRIAHNTAMDFLRKRARDQAVFDEDKSAFADDAAGMAIDPQANADSRHVATAALRTFMRLAPAQRSAVILTDVLGYEAEETAQVMESTVPAVKAALHRGRARLRELAAQAENAAPPPALSQQDQALLAAYADRFNARDWDGLRDLLADSVQLDLVARRKGYAMQGGEYFTNYAAKTRDLRMSLIDVEGKAALWMNTEAHEGAGAPGYMVFVDFDAEGRVVAIRDFRFARYVGEVF
ncbi:MAG: polymerase, sigma subunit, family [Rhodocyclales bacterium]|nr:polymerase, sigma subunit, family [Rhodocyclales bacterium]